MDNFSVECSKMVKNALYLKKSAPTVTHECQKVNSEQLFTEAEVNRPGYSPSRECGRGEYTGLFTGTEVNNYISIYQTSESVK